MKNKIFLMMNQIAKRFGKDSIVKIYKKKIEDSDKVLSSGSLSLNIILGINGYPYGRIIEIYGPESSGKTTLGLHAIFEAQNIHVKSAFIDIEHALDVKYGEKIGIDFLNVLICQPNNGEEALEIVKIIIQSKIIKLIVIDSIAALITKNEMDSNIKDFQIGAQARLISRALRVLAPVISKNEVIIIFINQIRIKIGNFFGNPEVTSGGHALKFYASIRIEIRKLGYIKKMNEIIGNKVRIKITKNKINIPLREIEVDIIYGFGISKENELIDLALRSNIIKKNGIWFMLKQYNIGKGKDNVRQYILKNNQLFVNIKNKIYKEAFYKLEKSIYFKIKFM